jgi:hypothetical protein
MESDQSQVDPQAQTQGQGQGVDDRVTKILEQLTQRSTESEAVARLAADPQVRQLLDLQSQGKKVRVLEDVEPAPEDNSSLLAKMDKLDEMSNRELAQTLLEAIDQKLPGLIGKTVEGRLAPIVGQMQGVARAVTQTEQAKIQGQLEELKKVDPQLDALVPDMAKLNKEVGGTLSVKELWQIARARKGPVVPRRKVETERPSSGGGSSGRGSAGLEAAMNRALDRALGDVPDEE